MTRRDPLHRQGADLARSAGIPVRTMQRYLSGYTRCPPEVVEAILTARPEWDGRWLVRELTARWRARGED